MTKKQIPHTKNKLTANKIRLQNTMAHNLTNLQVNKIRLQNATAHNFTMLLIFTLIFILQKVTKSDLLRRCEGVTRHIVHNVTKPPLLKQMAIYGRQDL